VAVTVRVLVGDALSVLRTLPADPVPCVVLDPFAGSGTSLMVADRLGRDAIGIELSESYAEMARRRIEQDAGTLFGAPVTVQSPAQLDFFLEASG
jgi:tRNA1(Val) A37 N6-methylase TrmN6